VLQFPLIPICYFEKTASKRFGDDRPAKLSKKVQGRWLVVFLIILVHPPFETEVG
jgi:hypothetical protein